MDFFRNPCVLPVAAVVSRPLVLSVPAAELDREAFVNCREVVAEVTAAADFLRDFAAGVGEVSVCVSFSVVLENSLEGAVLRAAVIAGAVVLAVHGHPSNRLAFVRRQVDVVVGGCKDCHGADAILEVLGEGVGDHGAEAEPSHEHTGGVNAVVFFEEREEFAKEDVVLVVTGAPRHEVGIAMRGDEDEFVILVELLLAVVRRRMVLVSAHGGEFFGVTAHAVHSEENLVRLLVVVVLREAHPEIAVEASASHLIVLGAALGCDFLERGVGAAALTRSWLVLQCVTKFECRCRRLDLLELHVESRVERAERDGKRVVVFGDKADRFILLRVLHESACTSRTERASVAAVRRELEVLLCAADCCLCKVGALGGEALAQVVRAGTTQGLFENLVAKRVENLDLNGLRAALIRENAVVDADVADLVSESGRDGFESIFFVFVDFKFTVFVGLCGFAFLEEAYRDILESLALIVLDGSFDRVGVRCST